MDREGVFIDFDTVTVIINFEEFNLTRVKPFSIKSLLCLAKPFVAWTGNFQSSVVVSFNKTLDEKKLLNLPASFNQQ